MLTLKSLISFSSSACVSQRVYKYKTVTLEEQLIRAIDEKQLDFIGINLYSFNYRCSTFIFLIQESLLDSGASPNIFHPSKINYWLCIKHILLFNFNKQLAQTNIFKENQVPIIHDAIKMHNNQLLELLLRYGADPNVSCRGMSFNCLQCAEKFRNTEAIDMLFKHGLRYTGNEIGATIKV